MCKWTGCAFKLFKIKIASVRVKTSHDAIIFRLKQKS